MFTKRILTAAGTLAALMLLALSACELSEAEEAQKNLMRPYISEQPQSASYYNAQYGTNAALVYSAPPTLSVDVYDWDDGDGKLTYQWYGFEDLEEYCAARSGTPIPGATGKTYTPDQLDTTKGKKYYYYVVVTNTNKDALDEEKSASIQSEIAVIAFSAPGESLVPILAKSPANARYGWGATPNELQARATAPDGGTLSYQWYTNTEFSVTGGKAVLGATQSMYIPDPATLELGDNYAYVIITNSRTGQSYQITSVPAVITIVPGRNAAAPRIIEQPRDQLIFTNDPVKPITVEAESLDLGALSYQWYKNSSASVKNGTPVTASDGTVDETAANTSKFTPAVSTAAAGTSFYYVVVTNTNPNVVSETKTATTASKPVKVQVGAAGTPAANAYFVIDSGTRYQYIRGYGGMDVAWGNFPETNPDDTELMYDPERLGYNMLRIMIRADNVDPRTTVDSLISSGTRKYYFDNVKIVNKYGGFVEASPWTPPKEWKSNNSINGGGNLIPAYYKLYANYLRNFAQYMYDKGAPIYCISISNEPNYVAGYDGCEWEPEEMRDFFIEVGHFTSGIRGFGGGRETPYVLTVNGESANTPFINNPSLMDPRSKAAIDVLARHIYGSRTDSLWNSNKSLITKKDADGNDVMMEVWMTEHNINSANATGYYNDSTWNYIWRYLNDVDLVIRMNNENAFVWWASKRFYSMIGDGQSGTTDGAPLPRGWALSHYSRYSIDYTRIGLGLNPDRPTSTTKPPSATVSGTTIEHLDRGNSVVNRSKDDMDNTSPRITAFISPDGNTISMVLWTPTQPNGSGGTNMGTMEFKFPDGFEPQGVSAHRSTGGAAADIFQPYDGVVLSADRKYAYITMGPSELLSVKFTK
jgi:O-glycosyl hydrolase